MMVYSIWQLIDVFIQTGELTDAIELLNQSLDENPYDNRALATRGEIYLRLGQFEQAITDFRAIRHPTAEQSIHHAVALKRMGIFGLALDVLTDAFSEWQGEQTDDYHRLVDCFVQIAIENGTPTNLQRALDRLAKVTGVSFTFRQAQISALLADYHAAIAYYSEAIEQLAPQLPNSPYLLPQVSDGLCARASCYQALGDTQLAIADYHRAERMMPDDLSIPMNRALLLNDEGLMRTIWRQANEKQRAFLEVLTPAHIRESEA